MANPKQPGAHPRLEGTVADFGFCLAHTTVFKTPEQTYTAYIIPSISKGIPMVEVFLRKRSTEVMCSISTHLTPRQTLDLVKTLQRAWEQAYDHQSTYRDVQCAGIGQDPCLALAPDHEVVCTKAKGHSGHHEAQSIGITHYWEGR